MMRDFIQHLPKVELHVHLEGSLEPELMFALAQRNQVTLAFDSIDAVKQAYQFTDLQSFLDIYYAGAQVLLKEVDFYDLTWAYLQRCQANQVYHSEIFFDPQTHTDRGIEFATVINGITRAQQDAKAQLGISSHLIMCFLRHLSAEAAMQTLSMALPYKDQIIGVGLDSSEQGQPPEKFTAVFDRAREEGFLTVAHAGEEGPPDYIWQAIHLLKVSRIDHGVRCSEDAELVNYLKAQQLPLTICPLSNVKLRVFEQMQDHNLKVLLDAGLCVTINSDDPAYFGGYMNDNFIAAQAALDLSQANLVQLSNNAITASFLGEDEKALLYARVAACELLIYDS